MCVGYKVSAVNSLHLHKLSMAHNACALAKTEQLCEAHIDWYVFVTTVYCSSCHVLCPSLSPLQDSIGGGVCTVLPLCGAKGAHTSLYQFACTSTAP